MAKVADISSINSPEKSLAGLSAEDLLSLLVSRLPNSSAPSIPNELLAFLTEDLEEKARKRKEERDMARELARRNAENAAEQGHQQRFEQSMCRHEMDNGHTALSGNDLSNGVLALICVKCQKVWQNLRDEDGNVLPNHLMPSNQRMGRPGSF